MAIAQSSEAIALIGLRILLVADTHQRRFQQACNRRQHFLARHPVTREIPLHLRPDPRQYPAEQQHLPVFAFIADLTPTRMVAILLAAARIPPDRLQVPVRIGTNPHIFVSRRDGELADPGQRVLIADLAAIGMAIAKSRACTNPGNTWLAVADIAQPGRLRRFSQGLKAGGGDWRRLCGHAKGPAKARPEPSRRR